ncbi:hypothetical protein BaRGS_00009743, partial [Batillaria attramentaria]
TCTASRRVRPRMGEPDSAGSHRQNRTGPELFSPRRYNNNSQGEEYRNYMHPHFGSGLSSMGESDTGARALTWGGETSGFVYDGQQHGLDDLGVDDAEVFVVSSRFCPSVCLGELERVVCGSEGGPGSAVAVVMASSLPSVLKDVAAFSPEQSVQNSFHCRW